MGDVDDAAHLQSMLEAFSDGELIEDEALLPAPLVTESEQERTENNEKSVQKQNLTVLYIGNLSPNITEPLLITLFSEFGQVRYCRLVNFNVRLAPYAFLAFYHHVDADAARKGLNGRNYLGQPMKIQWKITNNEAKYSYEHFRIFVGNLDKEVTNEELRQAFAPFGEISKAIVITDCETKVSKGHGFVSFIRKEDAETAVETMQGQWIKSRIIRLNLCRNQAPYSVVRTGTDAQEHAQNAETFNKISNRTSMNNQQVFVGNLNNEMLNVDFLTQLFQHYGCIQNIELFNSAMQGKPGFSFVTFSTKESACNAIMYVHNKIVNGRSIKCDWSFEKLDEEMNAENFELEINPLDFGHPIINFQRTIPGYGCPPLPELPPPLPPNQLPVMPECLLPPELPHENPSPPPTPTPEIDEKGCHAFSYYGTYVFQEKIDEKSAEEEITEISPSQRVSTSSSEYKKSPTPSSSPPSSPTISTSSVKAPELFHRKLVLVRKKKKSKKKKKNKKRLIRYRTRSRSRSRSHDRKRYRVCSRSYSRSRSRSRSRSYRRSRSRSREYDADRFRPRNIYYRGDTSHVNLSMPNIHPPVPTLFQQYPVQVQNPPGPIPFQLPSTNHRHYEPNPDQRSFPNSLPPEVAINYGPMPAPPIAHEPLTVNRQYHYNPNMIYNQNNQNGCPPNQMIYPPEQTQGFPRNEFPHMQNDFIPPNNSFNPAFQYYNPRFHFYSGGQKFNHQP